MQNEIESNGKIMVTWLNCPAFAALSGVNTNANLTKCKY